MSTGKHFIFNSSLTRDAPMTRRKRKMGRNAQVNKRGPRTREWEKIRRGLKREFDAAGRTWCEMGLLGCMGDDGLGFAHRYKRRHIHTVEELRTVALLCNNCHDICELQGEAKMFKLINSVIEKRESAERLT